MPTKRNHVTLADVAGNSDGRPGRLLLSSDGGATWRSVTF